MVRAAIHIERIRCKGCQLLLAFRFDWNGPDVAIAPSLKHAFHISAVGLRTLHVRTHCERRQQLHIVSEALELPPPVMGGAAGFHNDRRRRLWGQKRGQFYTGETVISGHVPGTIRDSNLENGFCQIDSNGRILHGGFLLMFGFGEPIKITLAMPVTRRSPSHHCRPTSGAC
jgi:hypothetical protein